MLKYRRMVQIARSSKLSVNESHRAGRELAKQVGTLIIPYNQGNVFGESDPNQVLQDLHRIFFSVHFDQYFIVMFIVI
jgi:nitrogenase molybdenum-iron protein alpha/beta subunit